MCCQARHASAGTHEGLSADAAVLGQLTPDMPMGALCRKACFISVHIMPFGLSAALQGHLQNRQVQNSVPR